MAQLCFLSDVLVVNGYITNTISQVNIKFYYSVYIVFDPDMLDKK